MFRSNLNENKKPIATENQKSKVAWSNSKNFKKSEKQHGYRAILKDFLENTSLHGLKYIGFTRITIFER